jgi:hypothetical protein
MAITPCLWLAKSEIFRQKFDIRNGMVGRRCNDSELRFAEYELIRLTRIINKHRRSCPKCKLYESELLGDQRALRPLPSEISPSQQDH